MIRLHSNMTKTGLTGIRLLIVPTSKAYVSCLRLVQGGEVSCGLGYKVGWQKVRTRFGSKPKRIGRVGFEGFYSLTVTSKDARHTATELKWDTLNGLLVC